MPLLLLVSAAGSKPATDDETAAAGGTIVGTITNLRSARGTCYVSLYNRKDEFPSKAAFAGRKVRLSGKECSFTFDKLPKGDYAIAAFHDENNNGRLDTNMVGLPTEGYAFSNNPRALMGPPSFTDAKITVSSARIVVGLTMKY